MLTSSTENERHLRSEVGQWRINNHIKAESGLGFLEREQEANFIWIWTSQPARGLGSALISQRDLDAAPVALRFSYIFPFFSSNIFHLQNFN